MGWFASFATVAFVSTVGADVQTFTAEQRNSKTAVAIKTVFVNEPGLLTVHISPTRFGYASAIAICPAGCNASQVFACDQQDKPTVAKTSGTVNAKHLSISETISNDSVSSHKLVVTEIGGYDVIFASCVGTHQKFTVTISGRTLDAHESGWEVHYAAIAVLYAGCFLAWLRIRGNLEATQGSPTTLLSDVSWSSVMLLGMACAGFVLHAWRPGEEMRKWFGVIICMTVPTLMTTLVKMTAVGFETFTDTNWCFEILWCVFAFLHIIAFTVHATYDNSSMFCLRLGTTCIARPGNTNFILIPLMGNCVIFGVSCCYCLNRSATVLRKTTAMGFVSRVSAMVAVYTALSMLSAFCRAHDAPSANPETWKSHFVSEITCQLTQVFGLATALYVFQQGIPTVDFVIHRVDEIQGNVDEEIQEGGSDDEQNTCIVPVVYGAE